jgi:hypothetical protein
MAQMPQQQKLYRNKMVQIRKSPIDHPLNYWMLDYVIRQSGPQESGSVQRKIGNFKF